VPSASTKPMSGYLHCLETTDFIADSPRLRYALNAPAHRGCAA
jgi:hypothetical protein